MPERPDLRQIASNIREALADKSREELLEILVYVFKEYVVEGPPPLLVNQAERIEDLEGLSFAQLIAALQTRLDTPELSLFQVDGDQVSARVGGVMSPLGGSAVNVGIRERASAAAPAEPPPRAGVQVVEVEGPMTPPQQRAAADEARTRGRGDLVGESRGAPRPVRGLSVRGRPAGSGGGTAQPPAHGETRPAQQPAAAEEKPAEKPPEKPAVEGDDASVRFSLLELD